MRAKVFFECKGKRYKYVYDGPEVRFYCRNCCFSHVSYGCVRPKLVDCIGGHWKEVKDKK